jgi:hypothetical protein
MDHHLFIHPTSAVAAVVAVAAVNMDTSKCPVI